MLDDANSGQELSCFDESGSCSSGYQFNFETENVLETSKYLKKIGPTTEEIKVCLYPEQPKFHFILKDNKTMFVDLLNIHILQGFNKKFEEFRELDNQTV